MGGEAITALSIAALPVADIELSVLAEVMRGGTEMLAELGVTLLGGHTVEDKELKFGYAVTGVIHPKKIITNAGAMPGDTILLTKALGTGIITSAIKFERATEEATRTAIEFMLEPNRPVSEVMQAVGVHAATDITGFGLVGHGYEMAKGSRVTLRIDSGRVPIMPQTLELIAEGIKTKGDRYNREYVGEAIEFAPRVSPDMQSVLLDPQTAGGMLISVEQAKRSTLIEELGNRGVQVTEIGEVVAYNGKSLRIF
jgi:selenide, water dikinase